nr:MAG TPA: Alginate and motility regulator [Caudoviricetes sp.]
MKMSPRTGRPIIGSLKDIDLKVRIDKDTDKKLKDYAESKEITKAAAVRLAIIKFLQEVEK